MVYPRHGAPLATTGLLFAATSCAYLMPASWQSFRADPDDAPIAITRALEGRQLSIASWDQNARRITTRWVNVKSGVTDTRERYIITWARDSSEGTLTVYVRHDAQDQDNQDERPVWGLTYHEARKERALLEAIAKELVAVNLAMPMPPPDTEKQLGTERPPETNRPRSTREPPGGPPEGQRSGRPTSPPRE